MSSVLSRSSSIAHSKFRRCDAVIFNGADHLLDGAELLVNRAVAIVLMGIAMFAVVSSIIALATTSAPASAAMTSALDSLLFAVILVEITATMRREERHSKLKWYLVIGIISAVREILTVGARISLHSIPAQEVSSVALEMGVTIVVIVGLAVALRLSDRDTDGGEPLTSDSRAEGLYACFEARSVAKRDDHSRPRALSTEDLPTSWSAESAAYLTCKREREGIFLRSSEGQHDQGAPPWR